MCLDLTPTRNAAWLDWLDLDGSGQRYNSTAQAGQLVCQILNAVAFFQMKISPLVDTAGRLRETESRYNHRHTINHQVTVQLDSSQGSTRTRTDPISPPRDRHSHRAKRGQHRLASRITHLQVRNGDLSSGHCHG